MTPEGNQAQVRCAHILLKHTGSRNPINRNNNMPVTRSKDEALQEIKRHLEVILQADSLDREFKKIATSVSECSSAKRGGDLGFFSRNQMQKPFSDAAFALSVGKISGVVETESGIHLIYRIA